MSIRENAAMHGDTDGPRATALALLPTVVVAAAVVVLALAVSGGRTGTIVVQSLIERPTGAGVRYVLRTVTETSADGTFERMYSEGPIAGGAEVITSGAMLERYVPRQNTIYQLSASSYAAAIAHYFKRWHATRTLLGSMQYAGSWLAPGRESFFKVQYQQGNYVIAGHPLVNGRRVLKLLPTPGRGTIAFAKHSVAQMQLTPVYVSPGSFAPIEEGFATANFRSSVRIIWTSYRVLPATSANERLVSLTARFPSAHISHDARAFVRATFGVR